MANLINQTDTLNQGREKLNAAIQDAENAKVESGSAITTSRQAVTKADNAVSQAESVQEQFNQVIIEGDSSVEAAAARVGRNGATHATLKERLDSELSEVSTQLEDIAYNVKLFGAVGDGTTDDAASIQSAIDYASSNGGGVVYMPPGRYYAGASITLKDNVQLQGSASTVIDAKGNNGISQIKTPTPTVTNLTQTQDILKGEKTLNITNNVKPGDFVEIASTARFTANWDDGSAIREYYTYGEVLRVETATPSSITFSEPVSFDFRVSENRWIRTFTPTKNIGIDNVSFTRDYSTTGSSIAVSIGSADNFRLSNIGTGNTNSAGIEVQKSLKGVIQKIEGVGGSSSLGMNYLINLNSGAKFVTVENVHGRNFRHVTTAGGSYLTSIGNIFKSITAENSHQLSVDLHANTLNYTYDNVVVDNGLNISGRGHVIKNVKSKGGRFSMAEGGEDILFEDIAIENCESFQAAKTIVGVKFRNVKINFNNIVNAISFGANPRRLEFEGVELLNKKASNAASNAEADASLPAAIYFGLRVMNGDVIKGLKVEGFPVGLEVLGSGASVRNVEIINCGWRSTKFGQPNTALKIGSTTHNSIVDEIKIACTNPNLDISASRVLTFVSGTGAAIPMTLTNFSDGVGHVKNYQFGIVGGIDHVLFMQNVRPTVAIPNNAFSQKGKFIYNTVVVDN